MQSTILYTPKIIFRLPKNNAKRKQSLYQFLALKRAHIGQCPEIGRKCPEIGHFLPGASLSRRVLPKHPCELAQSNGSI